MAFENREQAARLLAEKLKTYRGENPLVLGIPRGAIPMVKIIAEALEGELDVVLVHKLGAPGQPELAIGAVDEAGKLHLSDIVRELGVTADYIAAEKTSQLETLRNRRALYTPTRPPIDPAGRAVIVVDDGIATGATMIAALQAVRSGKPKKLVAAVGVAPRETLKRIRRKADDVVCLLVPDHFYAVGEFFWDFPQVSDQQVVEILSRSRPQQGAAGSGI